MTDDWKKSFICEIYIASGVIWCLEFRREFQQYSPAAAEKQTEEE